MSNLRHIVLTGSPGVGKSTIVKNLMLNLKDIEIPCRGFYTEEVRQNESRIGFDIISINDNARKPLARISELLPDLKSPRVGRYSVNIHAFDSMIHSILPGANEERAVLFIDEIGKMECYSKYFVNKVLRLFKKPINTFVIVATAPVNHDLSVVHEICSLSTVEVIMVDRRNRNIVLNTVFPEIVKAFRCLKITKT